MNGLNKSEKMLLSLLAIVLIGYVYYNFVISPITSKLGVVQNNINNYQQQLDASKIMAASNKKMTTDLEKIKANYNNYLKLMPKSNMTAQIERDIYKFANDNDVSLNNVTIGKEIEYKKQTNGANGNQNTNAAQANNQQNTSSIAVAQKIMTIPVVISITGGFNSSTDFINTLETAGRIIDITSVNFSSKGKQGLTVIINANMLFADDGTAIKNNYDFNIGVYGKTDPFK